MPKSPTKFWNDNITGKIHIAWHECDLSFDFTCGCGAVLSGGGDYCTYIKCPKCHRAYGLPLEMELKAVEVVPYGIEPKLLEE